MHGLTRVEAEAVRAFDTIAQAFGIGDCALVEWHRLLAFGELPQIDGPLLQIRTRLLRDLLLRVRTLAQYRDAGGQGRAWMETSDRADLVLGLLHWAATPGLSQVRRLGEGDAPAGLRAQYWEVRGQLLRALMAPLKVKAPGGVTQIDVLGALTFRIDRRHKRVRWAVGNSVEGRMPRRALEWTSVRASEVILAIWVESLVQRKRVARVFQYLLERDELVLRLLDNAASALVQHPKMPASAINLAEAVSEVTGLRNLDAMVSRVWKAEAFYTAALEMAPSLLHVAVQLHDEAGLPMAHGLGDLRLAMRREGITRAGWRWLVTRSLPRGIAFKRGDVRAMTFAALAANVFALIPGEAAAHKRFASQVGDAIVEAVLQTKPLENVACLARLAWSDYLSLGNQDDRHGFLWDFERIASWAIRAGWTPDTNQCRAGWAAVVQRWLLCTGAGAGSLRSLPAASSHVEFAGFVAVPIASSHELWAEGRAMHHCVFDFLHECCDGKFLAFSVRGPGGERVATLSFQRKSLDQPWAYHDCKGRFNSVVTRKSVVALVTAVGAELARNWQKR